jgi:hypothetical protein
MGGTLRRFFRSWLGLGLASGFGIDLALQRSAYQAFSNRPRQFWSSRGKQVASREVEIEKAAPQPSQPPPNEWSRQVKAVHTLLAGAIGIVIGAALMWAALRPPSMSPGEAAFYDICLAQRGNRTACDAALRIMRRESARPKTATLPTAEEIFGPPPKPR